MELAQQASVIGSGPNGLAAAIRLAQAGLSVQLYEAQPTPGGAARTLPLTLPGFLHDFGSAVHPLAAASPFFQTLPLARHGLRWLHHAAPVAHPLDDGTAVTLERDLTEAAQALGQDGRAWRTLVEPLVDHWPAFLEEVLQPFPHLPRIPGLLARFGAAAVQPASLLAFTLFRSPRTRALFAGLAAHSFLPLAYPASAAFGLLLGAAAHAVGWPIPEGGAQAITDALLGTLREHGGALHTNTPIQTLEGPPFDHRHLVLADLPPSTFARIAGQRLRQTYRARLERYRRGPAIFKLDYALSAPIPWRAPDCARASTVHLGGSAEEIAFSEHEMFHGRLSPRPFVLLAQPTLVDPSRAPAGRHIAWAYCHLAQGSSISPQEATRRIESQIERFAPGFRETILHSTASGPAQLQAADANLLGGDIMGGAMTPLQLLFRPRLFHPYGTPDPSLFLCSASTPPGGGVHGMCGFHAAEAALRTL